MNQSINTDSKNSKEPQQKYRLGTVSIKILGGLKPVLWAPNPSKLLYGQAVLTETGTKKRNAGQPVIIYSNSILDGYDIYLVLVALKL